ncbi:cupin domain-containing protein [bacterium]|nr:cupin domain-containing protein [bacterium]
MLRMEARDIIKKLRLKPLEPEGGYFREIFRSKIEIDARQIRPEYDGMRALFTVIHYLITEDTSSAPHRLLSDEIWFFHTGDPVELLIVSPQNETRKIILGEDILDGQKFQAHIPAGWTQSARLFAVKRGFALVSTVVIPGFEEKDFSLVK